jgi:hypothetical protein
MSAHAILRTGARMNEVAAESCALVLTSPPYFPTDLEELLKRAPHSQRQVDVLAEKSISFAYSLREVFEDCVRILIPGGALVLQSRDVRVHDCLIPTTVAHRTILESCGLALYTRYLWLPEKIEPDRLREVLAAAESGKPRPPDSEEFQVFLKPGVAPGRAAVSSDSELSQSPLLRSALGRLARPHRHRSPLQICELFIKHWTNAGDLVVDPFVGNGTVLVAATAAGRSALGYDVDASCIDAANDNLTRVGSHG